MRGTCTCSPFHVCVSICSRPYVLCMGRPTFVKTPTGTSKPAKRMLAKDPLLSLYPNRASPKVTPHPPPPPHTHTHTTRCMLTQQNTTIVDCLTRTAATLQVCAGAPHEDRTGAVSLSYTGRRPPCTTPWHPACPALVLCFMVPRALLYGGRFSCQVCLTDTPFWQHCKMFFKLMDACGLKRAHFCNTFTLFCRATPRSQRVMLMTSLATQTMLMAKQLQLQHKLAQKPIAPPRALGFTSPWPQRIRVCEHRYLQAALTLMRSL